MTTERTINQILQTSRTATHDAPWSFLFIDVFIREYSSAWYSLKCCRPRRQLTLLVQCGMTSFSLNFFSIQYNTIQYNTIQYNTIQYNTIQYNTIQCSHVFLIIQFPESSNLRAFVGVETAALTFRTKQYSTNHSSNICYGKRFYNDFFLNHNTIALVHNCLSLVSITRQTPRPRHKNKAIIRLSSHPSR